MSVTNVKIFFSRLSIFSYRSVIKLNVKGKLAWLSSTSSLVGPRITGKSQAKERSPL